MKIISNKNIITAGICVLCTAAMAVDENYQTNNSNWNAEASSLNGQPVTAQSFVWDAAITDMKEIRMGELALQKSDNSDVKSYAKDIISDHKKACKKLKAIAEKEGLNYPSTNSMAMTMSENWNTNTPVSSPAKSMHPDTERQNKNTPPHLASLMVSNVNNTMDATNDLAIAPTQHINWDTLSGAQFDRAFVSHMIKGHEKAINKFETASANLVDSDLKKYADKTLPTLRKHLEMAQELQTKIGMVSDANINNPAYQNAYQSR